jgi:hypothetical protein
MRAFEAALHAAGTLLGEHPSLRSRCWSLADRDPSQSTGRRSSRSAALVAASAVARVALVTDEPPMGLLGFTAGWSAVALT